MIGLDFKIRRYSSNNFVIGLALRFICGKMNINQESIVVLVYEELFVVKLNTRPIPSSQVLLKNM